jgi:hypothetical protein
MLTALSVLLDTCIRAVAGCMIVVGALGVVAVSALPDAAPAAPAVITVRQPSGAPGSAPPHEDHLRTRAELGPVIVTPLPDLPASAAEHAPGAEPERGPSAGSTLTQTITLTVRRADG